MHKVLNSYYEAQKVLLSGKKRIKFKDKLLYNLIAVIFTLFFASAPIALIVNLFLFEEYFNFVALAAVVVVLGSLFIYNVIILSIYKKKIEEFKYSPILITNATIYIFIGIIVYLLLIFPIKELILWLRY